ncbi:MAG: hypothetical protein ACT4O1_12330 [Gemmatimonadota bacterium]
MMLVVGVEQGQHADSSQGALNLEFEFEFEFELSSNSNLLHGATLAQQRAVMIGRS